MAIVALQAIATPVGRAADRCSHQVKTPAALSLEVAAYYVQRLSIIKIGTTGTCV